MEAQLQAGRTAAGGRRKDGRGVGRRRMPTPRRLSPTSVSPQPSEAESRTSRTSCFVIQFVGNVAQRPRYHFELRGLLIQLCRVASTGTLPHARRRAGSARAGQKQVIERRVEMELRVRLRGQR